MQHTARALKSCGLTNVMKMHGRNQRALVFEVTKAQGMPGVT